MKRFSQRLWTDPTAGRRGISGVASRAPSPQSRPTAQALRGALLSMRELATTPMRSLFLVGVEQEISAVGGEREGTEMFGSSHAFDRLGEVRASSLE
jgi:hypothetical protein